MWLSRLFYRFVNYLAWRKLKRKLSWIKAKDIDMHVEPLKLAEGSAPARTIRARAYHTNGTPKDGLARDLARDKSLIVYFHGGGHTIGDLNTHDPICRRLAESTGAVVVAVDYRLAPEHPYPAAPLDCISSVRWVFANLESEFRLADPRVFIAGDSAGGNLTAVVVNHLVLEERPKSQIAGQILIYPWVRHHTQLKPTASIRKHDYLKLNGDINREIIEYFNDCYLGKQQPGGAGLSPLATPMFADFDVLGPKLPPTLILTSGDDPLLDENNDYAKKLQQAGVEVIQRVFEGAMHGFMCSEGMSPAHSEAMQLVCDWMVQH